MQAAAIALPIIAAGASLASGFGQAASMRSQAKMAEAQAKGYRLQGDQQAAARSVQLNDTLSAINAIRAQRNLSDASPGALLIRNKRIRENFDAGNAERLSAYQAESSAKGQARQLKRAAPFAILGGIGSASASLAAGFEQDE